MRKMKDSGVEWIGLIPTHWSISRNKNLVYEINDRCDANTMLPLLSVSEYYGVSPKAERIEEGEILSRAESLEGYKICHPNDVAMNIMLAWKRAQAVSKYHGIISPAYCVYRKKDDAQLNMDYYHYLIRSDLYINVFKRYSTGIIESRLRLYPDKFLALYSHLPPVEEQEQIARTLDKKCVQVDILITNVQTQIEKLKFYKQSLITEVVTKGLDPSVPMKDSGVEWLGEVPEHWGLYRIANLYTERSENGLVDLPILTVSINTGVSDYEIADEDKDRVFIRCEDRTKYKRVYPGDLTYNMMRAWQGAFGAVRVNGMVSPAYIVAKPKGEFAIDSRYMEALLRTPTATEEMHRYSRGIMDFRLRLYWPEFKNIRVCLPSIDEQKKIADYIDVTGKKIDKLITIKQSKIKELEQYKKSLIYEYVTGKKECI